MRIHEKEISSAISTFLSSHHANADEVTKKEEIKMERKTFSYWMSQWKCWVSKVVKLSSNEWEAQKSTLWNKREKRKLWVPWSLSFMLQKKSLFSMKIDDVFMTLHSNKDVCICVKTFSLNAAQNGKTFSVCTVIFVNWRFNCSQLRTYTLSREHL